MQQGNKSGFTLIDVVLSSVILIVAIAGAIQFRYHAALQTRYANTQSAGAELALMLIETWRGVEGDDGFDPVTYFDDELDISTATGPDAPADYTELTSCAIIFSDYDYTATLSSRDIGDGLKALNVTIAWPFGNNNKEYRITSYADTN